MKRFAVIGHPIAHSLSPLLHGKAYEMLRLDCSYEAIDILPEALPNALRALREQGFAGINVTLPHKEAVASLATGLTDEARAVGAVNPISFHHDQIAGDNPAGGYGFQRVYEPGDAPDRLNEVYVVEDGDAVAIPRGYHPLVAAAGYQLVYIWALCGVNRIYGACSDDPAHVWIRGAEAIINS